MELNEFLQPVDAPVSAEGAVPAWKFGVGQKIQGKTLRMSNAFIKNALTNGSAIGTSGTFSIPMGSAVSILTTFQYNPPHVNDAFSGIPFIGIYESNIADKQFQIFPKLGLSIPAGRYRCYGGYDASSGSGNDVPVSVTIENVNGTATVFFYKFFYRLANNVNTGGTFTLVAIGTH